MSAGVSVADESTDGAGGEPRQDTGGLERLAVPGAGDGHLDHRAAEHPGPRMIEVLVCPASGGPLEYDRAAGELVSRAARLAYPIRSGIPIMLVGEARQIED